MRATRLTFERVLRRPECWGLLLRFLVMPIACHYDLLSYYWAAHEVVYHHHVPFAGQTFGALYQIFPTAWLNVAWLWLIKPLLGSRDPWTDNWFPSGDVYQTSDVAWHAFVSLPNIGVILFLLKLPFLFGEWALIRWLSAVPNQPVARRRAAAFLWLNPVSIFILYVFGSMEIWVLVALAGCLACACRGRWVASALLLGVAGVLRTFPVLFIPALMAAAGGSWRRRLRLGLCAALPVIVWYAIAKLRDPGALAFIAAYPSHNFLLSLRWPMAVGADGLYPFVAAYVLVLGMAGVASKPSVDHFARTMTAILLTLYALSFFHPQYFIWCIPSLALLVAETPSLVALFAIQTAAYVLYTFQWGRPLAGYLFAPINPDAMMALRSPLESLSWFGPPEKVVGLAHSLLAGASLWMAYHVLQRRVRPVPAAR